jgi:flagellar hook-associated protein 1 FlgK
MSINTIMSTANTGLVAAQAGLRTVSDNIANANTPGYVRKILDQSSLVSEGAGAGVSVDGVRRVVDRYLGSASLTAASSAGGAGVLAEMLDRAQGLFGDPSGDDSFFGGLDDVFNQFAALANDPSSALQRGQALSELKTFFDDANRISSSMNELRGEADTRIRGDVDRANDLLKEIAKLNGDIRKARVGGSDSSGSENIQSQLVDELAGLINLQSSVTDSGGVILRTTDGKLLADEKAGSLTYNRSETAAGFLTVAPADGGGQSFDAAFTGGEIVGLLQSRNSEIPGALSQLANFMEAAARELNRAHNANSAVPAPTSLTGKNTGLDESTAIGGFTGKTTLALTDNAGVIQNRVEILFSGAGSPSIKVDGNPAVPFTAGPPSTFASVLNTALGTVGGSASFTGGVLSLSGGTKGIAVVDDDNAPSLKAGQGFSQFFGLNDLVRSATPNPDTGLRGTDAHGFGAGETITFRLSQDNGTRMRDVTVAVAGTTMNDLVATLNASSLGVSPEGKFTLDGNGRLTFTSLSSPPANLSVVDDKTRRGAGGPSISSFFGLGIAGKASAAAGYSINPAVQQNPALLAVGKVNLSVGAGLSALAAGDGRGALALSKAGDVATAFVAANGLPASTMTLSRYTSEFAGSLGRRASAAETAMNSANSVKTEADSRRSSYEGVNVDEELVRLTTYQQAFNASARLIQAANELYDVLLKLV